MWGTRKLPKGICKRRETSVMEQADREEERWEKVGNTERKKGGCKDQRRKRLKFSNGKEGNGTHVDKAREEEVAV
jgi:hypothetical protein